MIQVCSSCGTRWNVRDQRREWCPRCRAALLAPTGAPAAGGAAPAAVAPDGAPAAGAAPAGSAPAAAVAPARPGYRWIAVRPGSPPRQRRPRVALGPTPHYQYIPRWSLPDPPPVTEDESAGEHNRMSARGVQIVATVTQTVLLGAAAAYLLRYLLMILNRTVLIYPFVALGTNLLAVLGAVLSLVALLALTLVLTGWLVHRRELSYASRGEKDPRSRPELWAGCVVPIWNLFWAPVFVIELATAEACYHRCRRQIRQWWLLWVASTLVSGAVMTVSGFALWTGFATDTQGVADTTLAAIVGYLLAAATVWALMRVFRDFEAKPVDRPLHRWVLATAPQPAGVAEADSAEPAGEPDAEPPVDVEPVGAGRVA
ncbi:MAG: DUF4328 domain-containing protein [Mycolicibacterium insubricum]|nr:DUF4328 domain-containing protein [Mycobacterium sp.]